MCLEYSDSQAYSHNPSLCQYTGILPFALEVQEGSLVLSYTSR